MGAEGEGGEAGGGKGPRTAACARAPVLMRLRPTPYRHTGPAQTPHTPRHVPDTGDKSTAPATAPVAKLPPTHRCAQERARAQRCSRLRPAAAPARRGRPHRGGVEPPPGGVARIGRAGARPGRPGGSTGSGDPTAFGAIMNSSDPRRPQILRRSPGVAAVPWATAIPLAASPRWAAGPPAIPRTAASSWTPATTSAPALWAAATLWVPGCRDPLRSHWPLPHGLRRTDKLRRPHATSPAPAALWAAAIF